MNERRGKDILEGSKRHWIKKLVEKGEKVEELRKMKLTELIKKADTWMATK